MLVPVDNTITILSTLHVHYIIITFTTWLMVNLGHNVFQVLLDSLH